MVPLECVKCVKVSCFPTHWVYDSLPGIQGHPQLNSAPSIIQPSFSYHILSPDMQISFILSSGSHVAFKSQSSRALLEAFVDCSSCGNLFAVLTLIVLVGSVTYSHSLIVFVCHFSPSGPLSILECKDCVFFLSYSSTKHNK